MMPKGVSGTNDRYGGGIFVDQVDGMIVSNSFWWKYKLFKVRPIVR